MLCAQLRFLRKLRKLSYKTRHQIRSLRTLSSNQTHTLTPYKSAFIIRTRDFSSDRSNVCKIRQFIIISRGHTHGLSQKVRGIPFRKSFSLKISIYCLNMYVRKLSELSEVSANSDNSDTYFLYIRHTYKISNPCATFAQGLPYL